QKKVHCVQRAEVVLPAGCSAVAVDAVEMRTSTSAEPKSATTAHVIVATDTGDLHRYALANSSSSSSSSSLLSENPLHTYAALHESGTPITDMAVNPRTIAISGEDGKVHLVPVDMVRPPEPAFECSALPVHAICFQSLSPTRDFIAAVGT